jgi:hypothetical protein
MRACGKGGPARSQLLAALFTLYCYHATTAQPRRASPATPNTTASPPLATASPPPPIGESNATETNTTAVASPPTTAAAPNSTLGARVDGLQAEAEAEAQPWWAQSSAEVRREPAAWVLSRRQCGADR